MLPGKRMSLLARGEEKKRVDLFLVIRNRPGFFRLNGVEGAEDEGNLCFRLAGFYYNKERKYRIPGMFQPVVECSPVIRFPALRLPNNISHSKGNWAVTATWPCEAKQNSKRLKTRLASRMTASLCAH